MAMTPGLPSSPGAVADAIRQDGKSRCQLGTALGLVWQRGEREC